MEKINTLVPKEIQVLNVKVSEIGFSDFAIDPARADFSIDNKHHGVKMDWATLTDMHFHCHVRFGVFFFIAVNWNIDVYFKDVILDNGLSI